MRLKLWQALALSLLGMALVIGGVFFVSSTPVTPVSRGFIGFAMSLLGMAMCWFAALKSGK